MLCMPPFKNGAGRKPQYQQQVIHSLVELIYDAISKFFTGRVSMRVLLLCGLLLLLVACSSNSSTKHTQQQQAESRYAENLPATDLRAEPAPRVQAAPEPQSGYSRQFVLEEEVIASVRDKADSLPPRARDTADFRTQGIERTPPGIPQDAMPPLDKTYTLQLAAFKQMLQAIDYAERYKIDADQAGVARIMTKGELWYVLAYGVYISREDANQAKADLQAMGVPEPWVRTLSTLEALSKEATQNGY